MCDTYEGWPNRETWALNLWLTNEEGMYRRARTVALAGDLYTGTAALKGWVEGVLWDHFYETPGGRLILDDVGSLWRVDWLEVATSLRS